MSHVQHVTPPPAIPLGCIQEIIAIVREGRVRQDAACLYWCSMDILAYGGGVVFGPPKGHEHKTFGSIGDESELAGECCEALEVAKTQLSSFGAGEDDVGLDPATIMLVIQAIALAIELFKRFRR